MKTAKPATKESFPFLQLEVPRDRMDEATAVVWSNNILGLETVKESERAEEIKIYFADQSLLSNCRETLLAGFPWLLILAEGEVNYSDWESSLHGGFEPQIVGGLYVVQAENPPPIPHELKPLYIISGRGFGTGSHPTTKLIMQLIVENSPAGKVVLDVGSGSGILAVTASLMGAAKVIAVEIDADSIENAVENAELNSCAASIDFRHGSIDLVNEGPFEIVYANIIAPVISQLLAEGLADLVSSGGVLLASGIMQEEKEKMLRNFQQADLEVEDIRSEGNWLAMRCRKM
jgi:ribosomal protein L11 methyltransferase